MDTVFVYVDGTVGLRQLPSEFARNPAYYEPVYQPLCGVAEFNKSVMPSFGQRCFSRRGRMYDGRPIFSDDARWSEVREVEAAHLFSTHVTGELALRRVHAWLRDFLEPCAGVVLDERVEWSERKGEQAKKVRIIQIVVLPKEHDPRYPAATFTESPSPHERTDDGDLD